MSHNSAEPMQKTLLRITPLVRGNSANRRAENADGFRLRPHAARHPQEGSSRVLRASPVPQFLGGLSSRPARERCKLNQPGRLSRFSRAAKRGSARTESHCAATPIPRDPEELQLAPTQRPSAMFARVTTGSRCRALLLQWSATDRHATRRRERPAVRTPRSKGTASSVWRKRRRQRT
jgi:hypothetical protein